MTVKELIERLQREPPGMDVHIWDEKLDDWAPVYVDVFQESGKSVVCLLTVDAGPRSEEEPE